MDADEARISVLIVDDHRSFGEALGVALGKEADLDIVDVTADGESAVQAAEARQPDVALIDLQMPGMDGLETSRRIHGVSKETVVVVLTGADDELALGRADQRGGARVPPQDRRRAGPGRRGARRASGRPAQRA